MQRDFVDNLLAGCLDRPPDAWTASVDQLCDAHPGEATEIRRRFTQLIELGIVDPPAAVEDRSGPERLGHFRLLRQVGGGGMGVVYEAHDEKLDRRVALKVIRREQLYFAGSRQRFGREVLSASRLHHPNICSIYEADEIDGVPYLAMRFVDGPTLADVIDQCRQQRASSTASASSQARLLDQVALVEKLARALHAAHLAGLIQRDVKPGNVLIDGDGEPVLVDFGLARDAGADVSSLTRPGERLGTPAYMAPEQVVGGAVDRRADVYALGVLLYECLTLHSPFDSSAREDLYRKILAEPPTDPRSLDRGISGELCVLLEKALQKRPGDRFATAEEFADELRRILAHEPIHSRRPTLALRSLRWCQRNRAAAGILTATLIGLLASLVFLRQSMTSEALAARNATEFRALAWMGAARQVAEQDPVLAFKYAREALQLDDDPAIVAGVQEVMFGLRQCDVLAREPRTTRVEFSPDGRFLLVAAVFEPPRLFRRDGDRLTALPLEDTGWRGWAALRRRVVAFSADSSELALADQGVWFPDPLFENPVEGGVWVHRYDLSGDQPRVLPKLSAADGQGIFSIRFPKDPADPRFLVVSRRKVSLWTRDGGGRILETLPQRGPWFDAEFLPDGRFAAAGSVWSADGKRRIASPGGYARFVIASHNRLVVMHGVGTVRMFDLDGKPIGQQTLPWRSERDCVRNGEFAPSGALLLVQCAGGRHAMYDGNSLELLATWEAGLEQFGFSHFSPDGRRIVGGMRGRVAHVWDLEGRELDVLPDAEFPVWSPEGGLCYSTRGVVKLSDLRALPGVPALVGLGDPAVALSPLGERVVVVSDIQRKVFVCDAAGRLLEERRADLGQWQFGGLASERGRPLARFLSEDEFAYAFESKKRVAVASTSQLPGAPPTREHVLPFALGRTMYPLADGSWLTANLGQVELWRDGEFTLFCDERAGRPAVAADGRAVTLAFQRELGLWSFDGTQWAESWRAPLQFLPTCTALSNDHGRVMVGTLQATAYVWDLRADRETPVALAGHQSGVTGAAFSLDGTLLATLSADGNIRVWDVDAATTIVQLQHAGVHSVAFTRSGQLVSAGRDGTVRWWSLTAAPLKKTVAALDVGPLTDRERERVGHLRVR